MLRGCPINLVAVTTAVFALAAAFALPGRAAKVGNWDFSGSIGGELRTFPDDAAFPGQDDSTFSPSVLAQPELVYQSTDRRDRFTAALFGRWDADDDHRTHADIRELNWLHVGDRWDLRLGLGKVFWGVTESSHLVDIINQTDAVEDIDNEDKLGQPMINLNLERSWGTLGLFVLPGFRERTFPDDDARLRGALPIHGDDATYDSPAEDTHIDFALRWSHAVDGWDIGLAHFHGTSREPRLLPVVKPGVGTVLVPHYDQIDQTSLDLQLTRGAWLWKLEAMTRSGHGDRFAAFVGGFEHTLYQVFNSRADLGLLAEYLYDDRRGPAPGTANDDDAFLALRLASNDVQDTTILTGVIIDRETQATRFIIEAERRLGDSWKIELETRWFLNVPSDDPLAGIRNDDFITLRLTKFF